MIMLRDDMIFKPYMNDGYQCKMKISKGVISVRYGGKYLFTDEQHPYEVWYPDKDEPEGYQTPDDIWNYIDVNNDNNPNS